jgi:integrase
MKRPNPKYVKEYLDRHGKPRRYFRRPGFKKVALPGALGSVEFRAAYEAALDGKELLASPKSKAVAGTVDALVLSYLQSLDFLRLKASTQAVYRRLAEDFREKNGAIRVAGIESRHIRALMAKRIETPEAANNLLRIIRALMKHAIDLDLRQDNPATAIRKLRSRSEGFHTWEESEIAQFESTHALGTRARLAFALLLYTGQRRSDVVRMGRQHIKAGKIEVVQDKTGKRLILSVHNRLQEAIDATPSNHLTFLTTANGKPFTANGFGNFFKDCCREAGLPDNCAAHGLRKLMTTRLANAGNSANQIAAVTGHATLSEVSRYTRAANQETLASEAMKSIK